MKKSSQVVQSRRVRRGTRIFDTSARFLRSYSIASGEVLILRGGRPIDLVETGELLDPRIWRDATAIAFTDCTLASLHSSL